MKSTSFYKDFSKKTFSSVVRAEEDELEKEVFEKKKAKLAKKGIIIKTKEEKRQQRRERERTRKNKKKRKQEKDFDHLQDNVQFGETVHEPPRLKQINSESRRPGQKDLLLKKDTLQGGLAKRGSKQKMSMAKRAIMEKERQRVVDQYRAIKAAKFQFGD